MIFGSYFGRKPIDSISKNHPGIQMLVFSILLVGNVVFMSYRASITSELSVWDIRLPFTSLVGLLSTDYK